MVGEHVNDQVDSIVLFDRMGFQNEHCLVSVFTYSNAVLCKESSWLDMVQRITRSLTAQCQPFNNTSMFFSLRMEARWTLDLSWGLKGSFPGGWHSQEFRGLVAVAACLSNAQFSREAQTQGWPTVVCEADATHMSHVSIERHTSVCTCMQTHLINICILYEYTCLSLYIL